MSAASPIFDQEDGDEGTTEQDESILQGTFHWIVLAISLILADIGIYRTSGYTGFALYLVAVPPLWAALYFRPLSKSRIVAIYLMLLVLA